MPLGPLQKRLHEHFRAMATQRASRNAYVFALEHELGSDDYAELSSSIKAEIAKRSPSEENWLCWVAYATELGYRYSGAEYWQTFEDQTPGWANQGNRDWLRRQFIDFAQKYSGAEPTGTWASHFSIICWPITHAILPTDLQRQLAKVLYQLRYRLDRDLLDTPRKLGEQIAALSWDATSRFRTFAEQAALLGQIASALLQDEPPERSLIRRSTLERIVADLEKERESKLWLKEARSSALCIRKGLSSPTSPREYNVAPRTTAPQIHLAPQLILDRTDGAWQPWVELPDFSGVLKSVPGAEEALTSQRGKAVWAKRSPLPRGYLLYGLRKLRVNFEWPRPGMPLVEFDNPTIEFQRILQECTIPEAPGWLFRVQEDGTAVEIRGRTARSNSEYIFLRQTSSQAVPSFFTPVTISCEGVEGFEFTLGASVNPQEMETMQRLGLVTSTSLRLWPVGLPPCIWDGEGYSQWLSTDEPCFAVKADFHVTTYRFAIDGEHRTEVVPNGSGSSDGRLAFVRLPSLGVGRHVLTLETRASPAGSFCDQGRAILDVRYPHTLKDSRCISALFVASEPANPSLDELWGGNVNTRIMGPEDYSVLPEVTLYGAGLDEVLLTKTLPPIRIPCDAKRWSQHLQRYFLSLPEVHKHFDASSLCRLRWDGHELGSAELVCEREFVPLRWVRRRQDGRTRLLLFDDAHHHHNAVVDYYSFDAPDILSGFGSYDLDHGVGVFEPKLGLYVAKSGAHKASIIITPDEIELGTVPHKFNIKLRPRCIESVGDLLHVFDRWYRARISGNLLGRLFRHNLLHAIHRRMFSIICCGGWADREVDLLQGPDSETALHRLGEAIRAPAHAIEFERILTREYHLLAEDSPDERVMHFVYLLEDCVPTELRVDLPALAQFALKLASQPDEYSSDPNEVATPLQKLWPFPYILRGARFLVLAVHCCADVNSTEDSLYNGWFW